MSYRRIIFSTVIDNSEIFLLQGYLWARSLIENASIDAKDILINIIEDHSLDIAILNDLGVNIGLSKRFGDGRYCNKAGQIEGLYKYERDYYVLMDADLFILQPLLEIFDSQKLSGKVVDIANPQIAVLDELFMQANFIARPQTTKADLEREKSTYKSNLNGGLYVVPSRHFHNIERTWKKWILWILDHPNILDQAKKLHHTDQIAFSMALTELNIEVNSLSREHNFPCHLLIQEDCFPKVLHYHHLLTDEGITNSNPHLKSYSGLLERTNEQISKWIQEFRLK
jgi:hypothetical protein